MKQSAECERCGGPILRADTLEGRSIALDSQPGEGAIYAWVDISGGSYKWVCAEKIEEVPEHMKEDAVNAIRFRRHSILCNRIAKDRNRAKQKMRRIQAQKRKAARKERRK